MDDVGWMREEGGGKREEVFEGRGKREDVRGRGEMMEDGRGKREDVRIFEGRGKM